MADWLNTERLRKRETERIARFFEHQGPVWLFRDSRGQSWPVSGAEKSALQTEALTMLDRHVAGLKRRAGLVIGGAVSGYFGFALFVTDADIANRIAGAVLGAGGIAAVGTATWFDLGYVRRMRQWRNGVADRLGRGAMPEELAGNFRRYELLRGAMYLFMALVVGLAGAIMLTPNPEAAMAQPLPLIGANAILLMRGFSALAWLCYFLANRVKGLDKPGKTKP